MELSVTKSMAEGLLGDFWLSGFLLVSDGWDLCRGYKKKTVGSGWHVHFKLNKNKSQRGEILLI